MGNIRTSSCLMGLFVLLLESMPAPPLVRCVSATLNMHCPACQAEESDVHSLRGLLCISTGARSEARLEMTHMQFSPYARSVSGHLIGGSPSRTCTCTCSLMPRRPAHAIEREAFFSARNFAVSTICPADQVIRETTVLIPWRRLSQ